MRERNLSVILVIKKFASFANKNRHQQSKHEGKRYQCEKCDKRFTDKTNLDKHIMSFHEEINVTVNCEKCNKSLCKNSLSRHQEWHQMKEEGLKFHCKECKTSYAVKSGFVRHLKDVHAGKKIEPVIVLSEPESLTQNKISELKDVNDKSLKSNVLPKPKKGKWIVKLERLKAKDFS